MAYSFVLSAVMLAEAAVILGCVIWREVSGTRKDDRKTGERSPVGRRPYSDISDASKDDDDPAVGSAAHGRPSSGNEKSLRFEKLHQDGIDAIMGYDLAVAKRAVRNDGEEE